MKEIRNFIDGAYVTNSDDAGSTGSPARNRA